MSDETASPQGRMRAFAGNSVESYHEHGMDEFPLPARVLINVVIRVLWVFSKLVWPWKFEDVELLTRERRGRVVIMNHSSMLDPVVLVVTMWLAGLRVRTVYKSEFDKVPLASWLFSRAGGFPVGRGEVDMRAIRIAKAALQRGECVFIFPEGTRVKNDGDEVVHGGYALMAQLAKAPVQPVAIVGARHLRFRSKVYLRAGEPIEWGSLSSKRRKEQVAEMEELGMRGVYELRDGLRAAHPGVE